MDKRLIYAIVLSMGVMLGYPYVVNWINPPKPKTETAATEKKTEAVPSEIAPGTIAPSVQAQPKAVPEKPVKETLTTVETPLIKAAFSSVGGGLKRWELKKYEASIKDRSRGVNLAESVARMGSLSTFIRPAGGAAENVVLEAASPGVVVEPQGAGVLAYSGSAKGLRVDKKYKFTGESYLVDTEITVTNTTGAPFQGSLETVLAANVAGKDASGYHTGPLVSTAKGKLLRQAADEAQKTGAEPPRWMGLESKYFLSAIIPSSESALNWLTEVSSSASSKATLSAQISLAPGETKTVAFKTFIGPKEYDLLLSYKAGLEEAIEFGWFAVIAKPFLVVLNFLERYVGNYGIAIIILTFMTKVVFYPLTKHSLKSMKELQNIQPQLAAIKEKYKDNKEKLNKELMELYKRYKVNPVGGCLPMILQIPVFIGLYEVLYVAIELRHAPFFFWITDLSDKDPYYISPIIMGATMFLQQKMTPTTVDPAQAKIMLIMPVVFTFMFLSFPSGLVIYWLVNNVLSIAQQYYIQRTPAKAKA